MLRPTTDGIATDGVLSETGGRGQGLGTVRHLPGDARELAPEVSSGDELGVNRTKQIKVLDDRAGTKVEDLEIGRAHV